MIPVSLLVVAVVVGFLVLVAVAVFLTLIKNNHSSSIKQGSSVSGNFVRELDKPITDVYKLSRTSLGEGASGKCYIATQIGSDRRYAVKTIDTRDENDKKYYERECQILKTVGEHYNVVRLFEVYRSPTSLHFVMELCLGGHLEEALERQPEHKFSESTVQRYVIQLLSAVAHCHRLGICHRDIKLQNILLESTMPGAPIKLIDFGNAKSFVNKVPMNQVVGTPYAMAPEMIKNSYDERCDIWSIGVVTYILLSGERPFKQFDIPNEPNSAHSSLTANILMGRYGFNDECWQEISTSAISFIALCLILDYTKRPGCKDLLALQWCNPRNDSDPVLNTTAMRSLNYYLTQKKRDALGRASMLAVAFTMPAQKAKDLRDVFQQMDLDGSGWVDRAEFRRACAEVNPNMTKRDVDALFDAIDQDGNKQISFLEFVAAMVDPRDVDVKEINQAFKLLDKDNKGYISHEDLYRVLATSSNTSSDAANNNLVISVDAEGNEDSPAAYSHVVDTFGFAKGNENNRDIETGDMKNTCEEEKGCVKSTSSFKGNSSKMTYKLRQSLSGIRGGICGSEVIPAKGGRRGSGDKSSTLHAKIKNIIEQADVDNDGKISYAEFVLSMSNGQIRVDTDATPNGSFICESPKSFLGNVLAMFSFKGSNAPVHPRSPKSDTRKSPHKVMVKSKSMVSAKSASFKKLNSKSTSVGSIYGTSTKKK